jgi:hypothetical protein
MGAGRQYSGISLNRLFQARVALSRGTDASGGTVWVAESSGHKAVGRTRIEALDRIREMSGAAAGRGADDLRQAPASR